MAKGPQNEAMAQGRKIASTSAATTSSALQGGGAFGQPGLTADYSAPKAKAQEGATTGMETGGYDPDILKGMRSTAADYAITGGVDPAATARYQKLATEGPDISPEATNAYKDVIANKGLDPEAAATYREFNKTGGFSDADRAGFIRQATSGTKSAFGVLSDQARRAAAASGGLGGPAALASLGRGALQQQAETTTSALNDINAQVRANRLKGAAGLDEGTARELTAAGGLGAQDTLRLQGQQIGAGGLTDVAKLKQGGLQTQAGIESNVAQQKLQYNQLMNLMGTEAGQQILSLMGIDSSNQQEAAKIFAQMAQQPGIFDNIMKVAGLAVNAGQMATGMGWKPFGAPPPKG